MHQGVAHFVVAVVTPGPGHNPHTRGAGLDTSPVLNQQFIYIYIYIYMYTKVRVTKVLRADNGLNWGCYPMAIGHLPQNMYYFPLLALIGNMSLLEICLFIIGSTGLYSKTGGAAASENHPHGRLVIFMPRNECPCRHEVEWVFESARVG